MVSLLCNWRPETTDEESMQGFVSFLGRPLPFRPLDLFPQIVRDEDGTGSAASTVTRLKLELDSVYPVSLSNSLSVPETCLLLLGGGYFRGLPLFFLWYSAAY